jgi:type IV fimbrial biogenesis protein FimT
MRARAPIQAAGPAMMSHGFGLLELLIVLMIAAVLLAIAAPSMRDLLQKQAITTAANEFFSALGLARAEAMARGARVDLVPLAADGEDWSGGWQVFVDENGNRRPDSGEQVLLLHPALPAPMRTRSVLTDATAPLYIAYNGNGRTRTDAGIDAPQLGTVSFFLDAQIRRIKINFLGRARLCDPATDAATCT